MGTTIRWLHLTDLHVGMTDQDWLWPQMRSKFRESLQSIYQAAGPWDLVLFTGDLVQSGTEYSKLDEILDEVWNWFAELGCDPQLLPVPGNHDLQWRDATQAALIVLENWANAPDVRKKFWNDANNEYVQQVKSAFAAYETWWRGTPHKPAGIRPGMLPGDFSYTFVKDDLRLGIVGLNTAFLQLTDRSDYQGRLALHPKQFQAACGGDGVRWAEAHHACLLLTHHPADWLDAESREHLNGNILENFCLHLCGHRHETGVCQVLTGGADDAPLQWLGRSLFGLETCDDGKLNRSHGYAAGELRARAQGKAQMQFMPRRREVQGDTWELVPDVSVKLPKNERTRSFPVKLRKVKVPLSAVTPAAPQQSKSLYRGVIDAINQVLEANPGLRGELDQALCSNDPERRNAAADIVELIFSDGLYQVLVRLVGWLRTAKSRTYREELLRLVEAFSALGVPSDRLEKLQQQMTKRRVDVNATSTPSIAAMIAAALLDVPIEWIENRHGRDPIPKLYVAISDDEVPYTSQDRDCILRELKRRLILSSCLDLHLDPEHPEADKRLAQRLKGMSDSGTPVITLLREDEVDLIDGDPTLDWSSLLVFRKKADVDDVIPDALSVSTVLQRILIQLRK